MNIYSQGLVSGLISGASYALLGVGLVLVYRTTRILNLAHGETFVIAAVATYLLAGVGVPLYLAAVVAAMLTVLAYWSLQKFALESRNAWSTGSLILITLGAAFLVRGALVLLIGSDPISIPPLIKGRPILLLGAAIPRQGALLIVVGFSVATAVTVFLSRTRLGKELIATAENPAASQLLGINVRLARSVAYGISGGMGALAAVLLVPLISIDYNSGLSMTIRGFIAASIAGMSAGRTVVAALLLGILESYVAVFFGSLLQDPVVFGLLIAIALWQSRGIRHGGAVRA
jgi:branched-chain amino acid transport system permease protein